MEIRLAEIGAPDVELLADWLSSRPWPYHGNTRVDAAWVRDQALCGYFFGAEARSFWIFDVASSPVGFVRAFDLADVTPLVDLRVDEGARGRGVGTAALKQLTRLVFEGYPETPRMGGYTRSDNHPMRRVFEKCGFSQEAHHRQAWTTDDGGFADAVGYAILRSEWR